MPDVLDRLQREPWKFGFIALLRRIGSDLAIPPIGTAKLPRYEPFRLGQRASLAFAPREIADASMKDGLLYLNQFGLGVLGANGPLPLFITEIVRERSELRNDHTLAAFLNIFHHRLLALFYRTWALSQSAISLDRPDDDYFSRWVASLGGSDVDDLEGHALPPQAWLSAMPHTARDSRGADGLKATLAHYFDVNVKIEELAFYWMQVEPSDVGRYGQPGRAATTGQGAFMGSSIPDRQSFFRVVLGPMPLDIYRRFVPGGDALPRLIDWVRAFYSEEYEWELELRICADSVPAARIGDEQQLGWTTWMGAVPQDRPVVGMVYRPESYVSARAARKQG